MEGRWKGEGGVRTTGVAQRLRAIEVLSRFAESIRRCVGRRGSPPAFRLKISAIVGIKGFISSGADCESENCADDFSCSLWFVK